MNCKAVGFYQVNTSLRQTLVTRGYGIGPAFLERVAKALLALVLGQLVGAYLNLV